MAAQTAKQVIIQNLRDAERNVAYDELKEEEGQTIQGTVQRRDRNGSIIIDLGKITGILPQTEQIYRESYKTGSRLRFYIMSVNMGKRGLEIILSRSNVKMVQAIFEQEIPEIDGGSVEIKGIARDSGNRSKVSVWTDDDTIDPVGACIGQRGSRINTIIDELGGEKIDIIQYNDNNKEYIKQSLSPAKIANVELHEEKKEATVYVAEDQFSLAIGRGGQNVRLAAELTGWKIKVVQQGNEEKIVTSEDEVEVVEKKLGKDEKKEEKIEEPQLEADKSLVQEEKKKTLKKKAMKKKVVKKKDNKKETERVEENK